MRSADEDAGATESLMAVNAHKQDADGLKERVGALERTSSDLKGRLD